MMPSVQVNSFGVETSRSRPSHDRRDENRSQDADADAAGAQRRQCQRDIEIHLVVERPALPEDRTQVAWRAQHRDEEIRIDDVPEPVA